MKHVEIDFEFISDKFKLGSTEFEMTGNKWSSPN